MRDLFSVDELESLRMHLHTVAERYAANADTMRGASERSGDRYELIAAQFERQAKEAREFAARIEG